MQEEFIIFFYKIALAIVIVNRTYFIIDQAVVNTKSFSYAWLL